MENMEKKSNVGLIIVIVLLLLVILGLCGYIAYDKGLIFNNEPSVNENEESKDKENNKNNEKEITSQTTIADINDAIDVLIDVIVYEQMHLLTHESKMIITLDSLYGEFIDITAEEKASKAYNDLYEVRKINVSEVKTQYKKLFGEEPAELGNYGACIVYEFDTTNNFYYKIVGECGYTPVGAGIESYINSYTEDENNIYAYVSVGHEAHRIQDGHVILELYCDFELSKLCSGGEENVINEKNYQNFSEYKYTFKKNADGTFYYDKIERLK